MDINIIHIDNLSLPELLVYSEKSEVQLLNNDKPEEGLFIAESPKVVMRALDAGYEPVSLLLEEKHIEGEAKEIIMRVGDIPVYTAPADVLAELTGFYLTRGVLCAMKRKPLKSVEEICAGKRRVAVLENVQNPTNVGAIIRSAAALNIDAVLLSPGCSNPLYRRAIRVSMGTCFQIPWTFLESNIYVGNLRELGFATVAMALTDNSVSINNAEICSAEKLAILLGAEGDGLSPLTVKECDYTVKIPMSHGVDSLNVAAASAVAFWQLAN